MSRSYRKPYASICKFYSNHEDKKIASKAVRHNSKTYLNTNWYRDDLLMPDKFECSDNDIWTWQSDGKLRYNTPTAYDWSKYCAVQQGLGTEWQLRWDRKLYDQWPPKWYIKYSRK
jgi:hypothetical protein